MILSRFVCAAALCAAGCLPVFVEAAEPYQLVVQTRSGAVLKGVVDSRTSAEQLWLRAETGHISLGRPIAWSAIREATHNATPMPVEQLRRQFADLASAWQPA